MYYAATDMEVRQCRGRPGGDRRRKELQRASRYPISRSSVRLGCDRSVDLARARPIPRGPHRGRWRDRGATNTSAVALDGDESLEVVRLRGAQGEYELECRALFSFIGAVPASGWLSGCAALDARGFVLSDAALSDDLLGEAGLDSVEGRCHSRPADPGLRRRRPSLRIGEASGLRRRRGFSRGQGRPPALSVHVVSGDRERRGR